MGYFKYFLIFGVFKVTFHCSSICLYKKSRGRRSIHDGKCKIKLMLATSAHQTMYRIHKGMKQIAVSNHEEKYIRKKKTIKTDYL